MDWTLIALTVSCGANLVFLVTLKRLKKSWYRQLDLIGRLNDKVRQYRSVAQDMNRIAREENIDEHLV